MPSYHIDLPTGEGYDVDSPTELDGQGLQNLVSKVSGKPFSVGPTPQPGFKPEPGPKSFWQTINTPFAPIPRPEAPADAGTLTKLGYGATRGLASLAEGFETPLGVGTLALGPIGSAVGKAAPLVGKVLPSAGKALAAVPQVAKTTGRVAAGGFAVAAASGIKPALEHFVASVKAGDPQGIGESVVDLLGLGTITAAAGSHALTGGKAAKVTTKGAEENQTAVGAPGVPSAPREERRARPAPEVKGFRGVGQRMRPAYGAELEGQPYDLTPEETPPAPAPKPEPPPSTFPPERPLQGPERPEDYEIGQPQPTGEEPVVAQPSAAPAPEPPLPPAEVLPGQLPPEPVGEPQPARPTIEPPRLPEHEPPPTFPPASPKEPKPARTPAASARPAPAPTTGGAEAFKGPEAEHLGESGHDLFHAANAVYIQGKEAKIALPEDLERFYSAIDPAIKRIRSGQTDPYDEMTALANMANGLDIMDRPSAVRLMRQVYSQMQESRAPSAAPQALKGVQTAPPDEGPKGGAPPTPSRPSPKAPRSLAELQAQLDEVKYAIDQYEKSDPDNRAVTPEENALAAKWYSDKAYLERQIERKRAKVREARPGITATRGTPVRSVGGTTTQIEKLWGTSGEMRLTGEEKMVGGLRYLRVEHISDKIPPDVNRFEWRPEAYLTESKQSRPGRIVGEGEPTEGLSIPAVESMAKNAGLREGSYRVVEEPDAPWAAMAHFDKDGNLASIDFNASKISSAELFRASFRHELAHWALQDKGISDALSQVKKAEWDYFKKFVEEHYGDEPVDLQVEETAARSAELLFEAYRDRAWYSKILAQIQRMAYRLGFKMSRGAAEAVAHEVILRKAREFGEGKGPMVDVYGTGDQPTEEPTHQVPLSETREARLVDFSEEHKAKIEDDLMSRAKEFRDKFFALQEKAIKKWTALYDKSLKARVSEDMTPAEWSEFERLSTLKRKMGATVEDEIAKYHEMLGESRESRGGDIVKDVLSKSKEALRAAPATALPEAKIDLKSVMPDYQEVPTSTAIHSEPFGVERIPVLSKLWGGRQPNELPFEKAIKANLGEKGEGRARASELGASTFGGDLDKAFTHNEKGEWGNLKSTSGASRMPADVIEAIKHGSEEYDLTPEQDTAIRKAIAWNDRRYELLAKYGLATDADGEIVRIGEGKPAWRFPRQVVERRGEKPIGGYRPIGRIYKTEAEGVAAQNKYEPSIEKRMVQATEAMYNAIANERLAQNPLLKGQTEEELVADIKSEPSYSGFSEQRIENMAKSRLKSGEVSEPFLRDFYYPEDVAKALNKAFPQGMSIWRRNLVNLNNAMKVMLLGFDFGVSQLQGLPMMFFRPDLWAKTTGVSLKAFGTPKVMTKFFRDHPEAVRELGTFGSSIGRLPEYLAGARRGEPLERMPIIGPPVRAFARQFTGFLDAGKIYLWESLKDSVPKSEWPQLAQTIESMLGTGRMESVGMSPGRILTERALFLAPSYYRGALNLIAAMGQDGVSGHIARRAFGQYLGAGLLSYYGVGLGLGMDEKELDRRLDPSSRDFLMWDVTTEGGRHINIGIGGIYRSLTRLFGKAVYTAQNDPEGFVKFETNRNPFMAWLRGHAGPGVELAWTGFSAKDFLGQKQDMTSLGGKMLPLAASTAASYLSPTGKPEIPGQEPATGAELLSNISGFGGFRPTGMSEAASRLAFKDKLLAEQGQKIAIQAMKADHPTAELHRQLEALSPKNRAKITSYAIRHFRSIHGRTGKYEGLARATEPQETSDVLPRQTGF